MSLMLVAACALSEGAVKPAMVREWLEDAGIPKALSGEENAFLEHPSPTEQMIVNAGWRIEAAWTLAWALNMTPNLGPFEQGSYADWFYENIFDADTRRLLSEATLRPEPEIQEAYDLVVKVHWNVRHCRLANLAPIEGVDPSVVVERHHALAWLTDPETPWDEVTTDT